MTSSLLIEEGAGVKPILLDAFCGAGGTTKGYQQAGFYVVGVDHRPQPNYCGDEFIQGDAIEWLHAWLRERGNPATPPLDAIHASPPCQAYTSVNRKDPETRAAHPALIGPTRELLKQTGLPYVIENVVGAPLRNPTQLCGRSLGLGVHRHRLFETNFPVMANPCTGGRDPFGIYGKLDGRRLWTRADGSELRAPKTVEEAGTAMGIDWMGWDELREAIPPAMTEHIGAAFLSHLKAESQSLIEEASS